MTVTHSTWVRAAPGPVDATIDERWLSCALAANQAGTPDALVAKLNAEMNKALKDAKLIDTFTKGAIEPIGGTPEDIGKLARADSDKYAMLVKELNIKVN